MKRIYRSKDEWVLCTCNTCGALNYVEPHGTTALCAKCHTDTEHNNIPYEYRDISGCYLMRKPKQEVHHYSVFYASRATGELIEWRHTGNVGTEDAAENLKQLCREYRKLDGLPEIDWFCCIQRDGKDIWSA